MSIVGIELPLSFDLVKLVESKLSLRHCLFVLTAVARLRLLVRDRPVIFTVEPWHEVSLGRIEEPIALRATVLVVRVGAEGSCASALLTNNKAFVDPRVIEILKLADMRSWIYHCLLPASDYSPAQLASIVPPSQPSTSSGSLGRSTCYVFTNMLVRRGDSQAFSF